VGGGQYRIDTIPLTDRLNIDDLVRCRLNDEGELVVSRRLKRRYPEKTAVRYERAEQYRLLRRKVPAAGGQIEGMLGPQGDRPGSPWSPTAPTSTRWQPPGRSASRTRRHSRRKPYRVFDSEGRNE
jgi:hypothetical protein